MRIASSKKKRENYSDSELLDHYIRQGDMEWLGILFSRYIHLIYGVCVKYLKDREDSRDAVMQIFERLTVVLKNEKVQDFNRWIYSVTRNHCLMILRTRKRHSLKEEELMFMESQDPWHHGNDGVMNENMESLKRCLEDLAEEQKRCVEMFYFEQKSYREIAVETKFELSRVKSYIQNGKRNLKICIENKKNE